MFRAALLALLGLSSIANSHVIHSLPNAATLQPRQDDDGTSTDDPQGWCDAVDQSNEDEVRDLWEERGVGYWMTFYLQEVLDPKDEDWLFQLYTRAMNGTNDNAVAHCGTIGASCLPDPKVTVCEEMVTRGYGPAYWILVAMRTFQSHLNRAAERLQNHAIENTALIEQLKEAFSLPDEYQVASGIKAYVSASLFIGGGIAGSSGVAITGIAKSRAAQLGVARSALEAAKRDNNQAAIASAENLIAAINRDMKTLGAGRTTSAVTGSLIYLAAPIFALSANVNQGENGMVSDADLKSDLRTMFGQAITNMDSIGKMATGHAPDGDYSLLPGQTGSHGGYSGMDPDYIQEFFADGKFLLDINNSTIDDELGASLQKFSNKLIDTALQQGSYKIIAQTNIDTLEACQQVRFASWYNDHCFRLWRYYERGAQCTSATGEAVEGGIVPCDYGAASEADYDNIAKFGLNFDDYVKVAHDCQVNGGNKTVDLINLPLDGTLPRCWYSIDTWRGYFENRPLGGKAGATQYIDWEDW